MKKIILMFALLISAFVNANAQEIAISSNKLFDNTYIGVGGVAMTPLVVNKNEIFPLDGGAELKIGKDLTPVFGFNIEGISLFGSNNFSYSNKVVRALNVGLNGTINLTNMVSKYKPNRTFSLSTETGFGWLHYFDGIYDGQPNDGSINAKDNDENDLYAKTGLIFNFNVQHGWNIYFEPMVLWDLTGNSSWKHCFDINRALMGIQAGIVYHFKTKNGTHYFKTYDITAMNDEINTLKAENLSLKNAEPKTITKVESKTDTLYVSNSQWVVTFAQNSAALTYEAQETLNKVNTDVELVGTASPEGNKAYNKNLSDRRVKAVASYLTRRGIKVVSTKSLGAVNSSSNRLVIISSK